MDLLHILKNDGTLRLLGFLLMLIGLATALWAGGEAITADEASEMYSHRVLVVGRQEMPQEITVYQLRWAVIPAGTVITNSYFILPEPAEVFPPNMRGVTFVNCAFKNVTVPLGNTWRQEL